MTIEQDIASTEGILDKINELEDRLNGGFKGQINTVDILKARVAKIKVDSINLQADIVESVKIAYFTLVYTLIIDSALNYHPWNPPWN